MEDYGLIKLPYGPKSKYGSVSSSMGGDRSISLIDGNMGAFEPDDIGLILTQLAKPIYGGDNVITWKDYARGVFHHPEGLKHFEEMADNLIYDYTIQLDSVSKNISNAFVFAFTGRETPKEAMDKIEEMVKAALVD